MPELKITDDLDLLFSALPPRVVSRLRELNRRDELLEVVLDLGRQPEARFPGEAVSLSSEPVGREDIDFVIARVGVFTDDNRAGIERTLHRISAMRNRQGRIIGLTCRIGRCVYGTVDIIRDVVNSGRSILLLGRPGIGKTTKLREVARILADEVSKRVVIVDTSNEIAGDGDIPHPGIGRARRMQVPRPQLQHAVMIEAVENHMPEVIVIDEIGTEAEAMAARTIAERGVQLVGTAHGNTLDNLIVNPTLSDLIGGIHAVTLSDEEAKRRGTQKTVLERKAPPTFHVVIEILDINKLAIHQDVAETVDSYLRGMIVTPEIRQLTTDGEVEIIAPRETPIFDETGPPQFYPDRVSEGASLYGREIRIFPYGVSRNKLDRSLHDLNVRAELVKHVEQADVVLTLKAHYRRDTGKFQEAVSSGVPVHVVRSNTYQQILGAVREIFNLSRMSAEERALQEAERAVEHVLETSEPIELAPRPAYLRRLQHQVANQHRLQSQSVGSEPMRRVRVSK